MSDLVSYAQNFEDVLLWRALGDVEGGFYIDIGANSPVVDSVSLAFHERGWRGINVEPSLQYFGELREQRPDDLNVHAALSSEPGLVTFYDIPETGLSTLLKDVADEHSRAGHAVRETVVTVTTLDALFDDLVRGEVHWMKIDVEGAERDVLAGWKRSTVRPWIVVVEAVEPGSKDQAHAQWETMLDSKGYRFAHFDGLNRYFVSEAHAALASRLSTGPNVFDRFTLSGTATSTFAARLNYKLEESRQKLEASAEAMQALRARVSQAEAETAQAREQHRALGEDSARFIAASEALSEQRRMAIESLEVSLKSAEAERKSLGLRLVDTLAEFRGLVQDKTQALEAVARGKRALDVSEARIQVLESGLAASGVALEQSAARVEERDAQVRALEAKVAEVFASSSWKATAPLRLASAMVRGNRREASRFLGEAMRLVASVPGVRKLALGVIPEHSRLKRYLAARLAAAPVAGVAGAPAVLALHRAPGECSDGDRLVGRMAARIAAAQREARS